MRIIKYIFITLAVIILLLTAFLFFYSRSITPDYDGEKVLAGLNSNVEVYFDAYGTPHIYADNDLDAYRALGYVHAQDRLWQMELMRRISPGRLAEIFGKELLETDKFFRTIGINEYSKKTVEELRKREDSKILPLAEAYLQGINQYQHLGSTPVEFTLLGITKEPFTLVDIYNIAGYMSFSFANAHKTDPLVHNFALMGQDYISAFDLDKKNNLEKIKRYTGDSTYISIATQVNKIFNKLPMAPFIGSNSWVLSPEKSVTGKVMLMNDPHIGFSQPNTWYEAHISTSTINYFGYHVAGVPFAFLIHNEHVANGLTMFENDDMDFYKEKVNEEDTTQYWAVDHWGKFEIRRETIKVKDTADVEIVVRATRHGPVVNDVIGAMENTSPVAMWWMYYEFPNYLLEAAHDMALAKNIDDMRKAGEKIHAPGLNLMYGDAQGNIAWWAVGKLVKRAAHVHSKQILDGASGLDDPREYYDFDENPQATNPPWGYVYSANNQPIMNIKDTTDLYPGYYLPGNRAGRIVEVLEGSDKFSKEDMKALFMDSKSIMGITLKDELIKAVDQAGLSEMEKKGLDQFMRWKGDHESDGVGASVFYPWILNIYQLAMKDDLNEHFNNNGEEIFKAFLGTHLMKRSIPVFIAHENSPWWDDKTTEEVEVRDQIITQAFKRSIAYLEDRFGNNIEEWNWFNVHTVEFSHPLGSVDLLKPIFNVGPFHLSGSDMVVNNLGFPFNEEQLFKVSFGPSTRRIIDFSNIDSSESILPTGQSGVPFSKHYDDQAEMYVNGKWRPAYLSEEVVKAGATILILKPE